MSRVPGREGTGLPGLFAQRWPAYRRWYEQDGDGARPSLEQAVSALERHMPELVPVWSALVAAIGADELGARMLTLYDPPPLLSGCSQAALPGEAALVRNYDYDPNLFDAVVLQTRFTDTRVVGMADQLWGLLDGVNDRGLAVSFTFGGRRCAGRGFSVPIVVRYLLETCATVAEGVAALERIPVQAAYNVTFVDRHADHATVWLHPGRAGPRDRGADRHQPPGRRRLARVRALDADRGTARSTSTGCSGTAPTASSPSMLGRRCAARDYEGGFGTLYTAVYRPDAGTADYHWPGASWNQSFADFRGGVLRRDDRRRMNRRQVLEEVAAGRLDAGRGRPAARDARRRRTRRARAGRVPRGRGGGRPRRRRPGRRGRHAPRPARRRRARRSRRGVRGLALRHLAGAHAGSRCA